MPGFWFIPAWLKVHLMAATDLLIGFAGLLLLMFPGWLVAKARGLPLPCLAGFILGAVGLVLLIQLFGALDLALSPQKIIPAWLAMSLATVLVVRRSAAKSVPSLPATKWDWPLALPLIPCVAVVAYRAIAQPLFGVDTIFRWNFLAEQMLVHRTLSFYPPVTPADYSIYAWPDGLAPVVSSLYFWVYNLAGSARPVLTAPVVIAQFILLLAAVYELGRRLDSPRAGAVACALVACSPILLWSVAMGEESGLLAVALIGMLLYLPVARETAGVETTILAGVAAGMGGLAREYGLAFIAFGIGLGLVRRLGWRTVTIFSFVAFACSGPWYARNWLHTGNPLFNLELAGLFPVNGAALRLMQIFQQSFGWGWLPPEALRIFLTNCTILLIGMMAGLLAYSPRSRFLFAAIIVIAVLWGVSLGYTSAGFTYSLRVLTPALAVAGVIGGIAVSRWVPGHTHLTGLSLALFIFATDASIRALVLPSNIYKIPLGDWLSIGRAIHDHHQRPVYQQLANFAAGRPILILGPAALLNRFGAHTIPPWSPEVAFLWDESLTTSAAAQTLTGKGITLFLVSKGESNQAYLSQIAFFRNEKKTSLQQIWEDGEMALFQINVPRPAVAP